MKKILFNLKIHLILLKLMQRRDYILGDELVKFEKKLANYLNVNYAIGVGSGTDALIYALKALGIGQGDEVIIPAMSFAATANAVAWIGATPVFVDINLNTFNIEPGNIVKAITGKTKAIIPVHLHGQLADLVEISKIGRKYGIPIIEDAAQAIGSYYKDIKPGTHSTAACFSFSPSKILHAFGDGGAVVTNDKNIAEKIYLLRCYGAFYREVYFNHRIVGTSSRLDNFQAGVLNIQFDYLDDIIKRQRFNCDFYKKNLSGIGDFILPADNVDFYNNGYRYVIRTKKRDNLVRFLREEGIEIKINYPVILPFLAAFNFLNYPVGSFTNAELAAKEVVSLPTSDDLTLKDLGNIMFLIKKFFKNNV